MESRPSGPAAPPAFVPPPLGPPQPAQAPPPQRKGLSCWAWGCIISGIIGIVALVGTFVCCGGPVALFMQKFGGVQGTMAGVWLDGVQSGEWQSAGEITVGGEARARELRQKIEDQVGRLQDNSQAVASGGVKTTGTGPGTAEVRMPIRGDRASGVAVFRMRQEAGPAWQVEDVTVEISP
jgi:hypothetical protein